MDYYIVLGYSNLKATEKLTGIPYRNLRDYFLQAESRHCQCIIFRLGEESWRRLEVHESFSISWVITHIKELM